MCSDAPFAVGFCPDRHNIFRANAKEAENGDGKNELGRIIERPAIAPAQAGTLRAKGRVERSNQTLQDRRVKERRTHSRHHLLRSGTDASRPHGAMPNPRSVHERTQRPPQRLTTDVEMGSVVCPRLRY